MGTDGRTSDSKAWRQLKEVLEERAGAGGRELADQNVLGRQRRLYGSGTSLRAAWDGMDLDDRRSIIDAVVDHFVVLPAPRLRSQFTAEHDQFRKTVRDVVEKEINPYADEWERTGIFPAHDLFPKLGALGILGLEYDPAYGGQGADHSYTLVYGEEMGRAVGGAGGR